MSLRASELPRPSMVLRDSELPSVVMGPVAPETRKGRRVALAVVLVLAFLAVSWVVHSLWVGVTFGTVMAFSTQAIFRKLCSIFGGRRHLAAAAVTLGTGLSCILTGAGALYVTVRELVDVATWLQARLGRASLSEQIGEPAARLFDKVGVSRVQVATRIHHELESMTARATDALGVLLQGTTSAMVALSIALFTLYYVLIEWPTLTVRLERVLPLDPRHTRALVLEFRNVGRSAFVGTVATALSQGALGGVAYAVAGVPQAVTWAALTALASFLPIVGTGLIWGGVGIFELVHDRAGAGFFILVWGSCVVMLFSDYVIRPRLVGRSQNGHPLLMLMALVGGIEALGLPGVIVAPVLMSLFVAIFRIYEREVGGDARARSRLEGPPSSVLLEPPPHAAEGDLPDARATQASPADLARTPPRHA